MKIFVNARFLTQPISGVQRYGIECSRQIKRLAESVTFLSPSNIIHHEVAKELDVQVIGKNNGHLWEQNDLPKYLKKLSSPPLINLANTAPLRYHNNYITIHDLAFHLYPEWNSKIFAAWYNFMVPRIASRSKHIYTVSETIKEEIIRYYRIHPSKISVTYNGICSDMKCDFRALEKEKVILSVGTFNVRKNQQNLVRAFVNSDLKNEYKLVLVGDRNKIFSESGLDINIEGCTNILVLEHISTSELKEWYKRAALVVSLSRYEGFGIPLLEGLNYGCKILCSHIPVYKELYDGFATFCDPDNIESIVIALREVCDMALLFDQTGINRLLEQYNYESSARKIISAINI